MLVIFSQLVASHRHHNTYKLHLLSRQRHHSDQIYFHGQLLQILVMIAGQ